MDLPTIFLSLGSGVVGAAATHFFASRREENAARRVAVYSALRLAVLLEDYSRICADYSQDCRNFDSSNGHAGSGHAAPPPLEAFPSDIRWDRIPSAISSSVLSLPVRIKAAASYVSGAIEYDFEENGAILCATRCEEIGLACFNLATQLRAAFGLPQMDLKALGWDHVQWLSDRVAEEEEAAAQKLARQQRSSLNRETT